MDNPLVSIIMTVYNKERYVRAAIESALSQSWSNLEIIVIDDGSTDNSVNEIKLTAGAASNIQIISQKNSGVAAARNLGFSLANGEFIHFLDGDDLIYPQLIAETANFLINHPEVDIVHTSWDWIDENGSKLYSKVAPNSKDYLKALLLGNLFSIHAVLSRKAFLASVGPVANIPTEDWELWARCAKRGARFGRIDKSLAAFRQTPESDCRKGRVQDLRFFKAIDLIFDESLPEKYKKLKKISIIRHRFFLMIDNKRWGLRDEAAKQFSLGLQAIEDLDSINLDELKMVNFSREFNWFQNIQFFLLMARMGAAIQTGFILLKNMLLIHEFKRLLREARSKLKRALRQKATSLRNR